LSSPSKEGKSTKTLGFGKTAVKLTEQDD